MASNSLNPIKLTTEEQLILADLLQISRESLLLQKEVQLSKQQLRKFADLQKKLHTNIPLAYILGYRWFYNHKFIVSPDVLIPRPETELLVQHAEAYITEQKPDLIVDIGTGSGAIIISLRDTFKTSGFVSKKTTFIGVDISEKALKVAKKNAQSILGHHSNPQLKIVFKKSNLTSQIKNQLLKSQNVLICANLPYLSSKQLREPTIQKEPKLALLGGKKSTDLIEKLIKQISKLGLQQYALLLEIDPSQTKTVLQFGKRYLPDSSGVVLKDLSGLDRVVEFKSAANV